MQNQKPKLIFEVLKVESHFLESSFLLKSWSRKFASKWLLKDIPSRWLLLGKNFFAFLPMYFWILMENFA